MNTKLRKEILKKFYSGKIIGFKNYYFIPPSETFFREKFVCSAFHCADPDAF